MAKKKARDHRSEVAALLNVVRTALTELQPQRKVPTDALAAIAIVEHWLMGDAIDNAALQAAADRSREEGVAYPQREKDRARTWARAAAGNLAWLAKKDRGWQDGAQSILDASVYMLSSVGGDGAALDLRFAKMFATAPTLAPDPRPTPPPQSTSRSTSFRTSIGDSADRAIQKRAPTFDATLTGTPELLRALLRQKQYTVTEAVLAFDARYGGLVVADEPGVAGEDWIFGAYACLSSSAHADPRGNQKGWTPVAYSPNDCVYFLDEDGAAWTVDTIAETQCMRFADDGDAMMRRIFAPRGKRR